MHESKVEGLVVTARLAKRFWAKVEKVPGGCWLWHGAVAADGYGDIVLPVVGEKWSSGRQKTKAVRAHRLAWRLVKGEWPPEFTPDGAPALVMHACDTRNCVKVLEEETKEEKSHLSMGSHAENSADMADKGRAPRGDDHYARLAPSCLARGSDVGTSKLTEEQVAIIKGELLIAPKSSKTNRPLRGVCARLAEHFGVTPTMINYIEHGRWWAHVQPAVIEKSVLPARVTSIAHNAILTARMAQEIHQLSAQGMTGVQIAEKFRISQSTVSTVLTGRVFAEAVAAVVEDPNRTLRETRYATGDEHPNAALTEATVREMRQRAQQGVARVSLAQEYAAKCGTSQKAIFDAIAGRTWKHVKDDVPILE